MAFEVVAMIGEDMNEFDSYERSNEKDNSFLYVQYQVLSNREINHENMMWQTPSIMIIGQTLLWSIGLNENVTVIFRLIVAILAVIFSVLALQLFLRHRLMEMADDEQLFEIENYFKKKAKDQALIIHEGSLSSKTLLASDQRTVMDILEKKEWYKRHPLSRIPSSIYWIYVFRLFVIISLLICAYNLFCVCG